jgi:hypothetical protein
MTFFDVALMCSIALYAGLCLFLIYLHCWRQHMARRAQTLLELAREQRLTYLADLAREYQASNMAVLQSRGLFGVGGPVQQQQPGSVFVGNPLLQFNPHNTEVVREGLRWLAKVPLPAKSEVIKLVSGPMYSRGGWQWEGRAIIEALHQDETGALYRYTHIPRGPWGTEFVRRFIIVENGTPGPDGTKEKFMLWVPSSTRTAKDGVAWTYGLRVAEYNSVVRT